MGNIMTKEEFENFLEKCRQSKKNSHSWIIDNAICGVSVYDDGTYSVETLSGFIDDSPALVEQAKKNADYHGRKIVRFESYDHGRLVNTFYPEE